jgi:hypothetical protein
MLDSGQNGRQDGMYSRATKADHEVPEQSHLHTTSYHVEMLMDRGGVRLS